MTSQVLQKQQQYYRKDNHHPILHKENQYIHTRIVFKAELNFLVTGDTIAPFDGFEGR